jgi:hypothetical protein
MLRLLAYLRFLLFGGVPSASGETFQADDGGSSYPPKP